MKHVILAIFVISLLLIAGCTQGGQQTQQQPATPSTPAQPTTPSEPTKPIEPAKPTTVAADFTGSVKVEGDKATLALEPNYEVVAPGGNKEGEGHFHLFLDGGSYIPLAGKEYVFSNLSAGEHKVRVTANNNDHTEKGVEKTFTFVVVGSADVTTPKVNETKTEPPIQPTPTTSIKEITLEVDDSGFYPTSTITVKKGELVKLTFAMRTTNVYFNGDRIQGGPINTGTILPGTTKTVEFTADSSFTFTAYWPGTNVRKADGQVIVE